MKTCTKCGAEKPLSEFHKLGSSSDGRRPDCKQCALQQKRDKAAKDPYATALISLANGIFKRTLWSKHRYKNRSYSDKDIQNHLGNTPDEVRQILHEQFESDIKQLLQEGKTPSVDRIDSTGHYELGNIRIIDNRLNVEEGSRAGGAKIARPVIMLNTHTGVTVPYDSVSEASRELGIKRDTIHNSIKNNKPTRYGLSFQYK